MHFLKIKLSSQPTQASRASLHWSPSGTPTSFLFLPHPASPTPIYSWLCKWTPASACPSNRVLLSTETSSKAGWEFSLGLLPNHHPANCEIPLVLTNQNVFFVGELTMRLWCRPGECLSYLTVSCLPSQANVFLENSLCAQCGAILLC